MTGKTQSKSINLSVITAVFNRVDMIEDTIESVLGQWHEGMEHIIIDGGSTDGTLDVIKRYPHLIVISEPDNGVYDAWNKGIELAKGNWINFLNSDDIWEDCSSVKVLNELNGHPDIQILVTNALIYDKKGYFKSLEAKQPEKIFFEHDRGYAINAWFIKKEIFSLFGNFDTSYKISSDTEFCNRLIGKRLKICCFPRNVYRYHIHDDSLTFTDDNKKKIRYLKENVRLTLNSLWKGSKPISHYFILLRNLGYSFFRITKCFIKEFLFGNSSE